MLSEKNGQVNMYARKSTLYLDQKDLEVPIFWIGQLWQHMVLAPLVFYLFSKQARRHVLKGLGLKDLWW